MRGVLLFDGAVQVPQGDCGEQAAEPGSRKQVLHCCGQKGPGGARSVTRCCVTGDLWRYWTSCQLW